MGVPVLKMTASDGHAVGDAQTPILVMAYGMQPSELPALLDVLDPKEQALHMHVVARISELTPAYNAYARRRDTHPRARAHK